MPRIQWTGLPPALRDHLFDRLRERKSTADDLYELKTWKFCCDTLDGGWRISIREYISKRRPALERVEYPNSRLLESAGLPRFE